jgi:predicted permease
VSTLPGVVAVAATSRGTLGDAGMASPIRVPGYVPRADEPAFINWNVVTPSFFSTAGIPIILGRPFTADDNAGSSQVVVISEATAKRYFGAESAIGKHIGLRRGTDFPLEIIGVAKDVIDNSLRDSDVEMLYLPYAQDVEHLNNMCVLVRTSGPPGLLARSVRRTLREIDSALPVVTTLGMEEQVSRSLTQERISAWSAGVFGILALVLASIGIYAVVAQSVVARRHELAIRLALGSSPGGVVRLIAGETFVVVACGVALGLLASSGVGHVVRSLLFGVSGSDPITIGAGIGLTLIVAGVATYLPATSAAASDPIEALKSL